MPEYRERGNCSHENRRALVNGNTLSIYLPSYRQTDTKLKSIKERETEKESGPSKCMVSDLVLTDGCDEAIPWDVLYLVTAPPNSLSLIMEHKEERKK